MERGKSKQILTNKPLTIRCMMRIQTYFKRLRMYAEMLLSWELIFVNSSTLFLTITDGLAVLVAVPELDVVAALLVDVF